MSISKQELLRKTSFIGFHEIKNAKIIFYTISRKLVS